MGYRPTTRIDGIFDDLVVGQGWGMYGDSRRLRASPPADVETFVDELLLIDGRDPTLVTKKDRQYLRDLVNDWIFDPSGRGARSGLPMRDPETDSEPR